MSADLIALAVQAAAHYAGVRGPWRHPTTMVLEADPARPSWLVVRDSHPARSRDALLFNPLPRKEIPMATPPPFDDKGLDEAWESLEFHARVIVDLKELVIDLTKRVDELEAWRDVVEHGEVRR